MAPIKLTNMLPKLCFFINSTTTSTTTLSESKDYTDTQKSDTLVEAQVITDESIAKVILKATDNEIIQGFTDKDGKLLAFIDKNGEFDFYPTAQTKNRVNVIQENTDSEFLYLLLDANNKIIDGIDKNGDRYPKDKINITNIIYEPWHFRFVGVDHAQKITSQNLCLEEYIESLI